MSSINELKVGQTVWMKYSGSDKRHNSEAKQGTITKIGRKYFEVNNNDWTGGQFHIETLMENIDSNYRDRVYLSLEQIEYEKEYGLLNEKIKKAFGGYGDLPYTVEQLKAIWDIIFTSKEPNVQEGDATMMTKG